MFRIFPNITEYYQMSFMIIFGLFFCSLLLLESSLLKEFDENCKGYDCSSIIHVSQQSIFINATASSTGESVPYLFDPILTLFFPQFVRDAVA